MKERKRETKIRRGNKENNEKGNENKEKEETRKIMKSRKRVN